MGCCTSNKLIPTSGLDIETITQAINKSQLKTLTKLKVHLLKSESQQSLINEGFILFNNIKLSPLGYALYREQFKSFKHLHENLGASFEALDLLLEKANTSIIEFICNKGLLQFLSYYLPIYEKYDYHKISIDLNETTTFDFDKTIVIDSRANRSFTPLQLAVNKCHLHIVDYICEYFDGRINVIKDFDINYQDDYTGENCAMIACRRGILPMVKYLYENTKANFKALNKRNENVLVITAAASKTQRSNEYFQVFAYLIEHVKVDFSSSYEDLLLLLEDEKIVQYFETVLERCGIKRRKSEVEEKFRPNPFTPVMQFRVGETVNENFQLGSMKDSEASTQSVLSNIKPDEGRMTVFLASILSYFDRDN
ncbi:hypothetical protein SteCoe_10636 [Stentor coeruleus]|uniref:Uncharacterized protein n=1 Tax=Stentor coeruleus TaxID=5963 RepID=A0A1R2CFA6_9CILI|nr:hypothetical protein SteCoe_10636 [Stentor coeruleus]